MRRLLLLLALVLSAELACAQAPMLVAVDVYGTQTLDAVRIRAELGKDLDAWREALQAKDPEVAVQAKERVLIALKKRGNFALVEPTLISYPRQPPVQYITIDVVEQTDRARRMPFAEPPTGKVADPEGLVQLWNEYQTKLFAITRDTSSTDQCEVLHCLVPFKTYPQLLPYLERINDKVRHNEQTLYDIAQQDAALVNRGMAIYLLAHSNDIDRLLVLLGRAIYDPSSYVRNNAMRVMAQIAERYPERNYPIQDLVNALDFAVATDRNKAAYTLSMLVDSSHRAQIMKSSLPSLLRLLRLQQPINHEPAFEILKRLSGESFGERDYEAWERWVVERTRGTQAN